MQHRFFNATIVALLALALSAAADAQTTVNRRISELQSQPNTIAALSDAVATQSPACSLGNCRTTIGQILGALGAGTVVSNPSPADYIVLVPQGPTPRTAPISSLSGMLGFQSMAQQDAAHVAITGGTISGVSGSMGSLSLSSLQVGGTAAAVGSSSAALKTDAAGLTGQLNNPTVTGTTIYQYIIGCVTCVNADAVRGTATATAGSTVTNTSAIAGYVLNQNPNGGTGQNAVSLFGTAISAVDGSQTWGLNTNLSDNVSSAVSSGHNRVLNNELDFNITSPYTQVNGLVLQGASAATPAQANGFVVENLRINTYAVPWNNAFLSGNGGATVALYVGTLGSPSSANTISQSVSFIHTNSGSGQVVDQLYDTPTALTTGAAFQAASYRVGATAGAPSCAGTPTSSFAVVGGLVTHC